MTMLIRDIIEEQLKECGLDYHRNATVRICDDRFFRKLAEEEKRWDDDKRRAA